MQTYPTRSEYLSALAAKRLTRNCVYCGSVFQIPPCQKERNHFCSRRCFLQWQRNPERFWERVDRSGECWLWTGGRHKFGYGKCDFRGNGWNAHALSWFLTNGPIPRGLCVLHRCDNPPCCNPAHLFLGTKGDNSRDMFGKGRQARPLRGDLNPRVKLTDAQVHTIRGRLSAPKNGKFPYGTLRRLAEEFHVSDAMINKIAHGTKRIAVE